MQNFNTKHCYMIRYNIIIGTYQDYREVSLLQRRFIILQRRFRKRLYGVFAICVFLPP